MSLGGGGRGSGGREEPWEEGERAQPHTLLSPTPAVSCPTDSRKRPDQRLLEEGDLEAAGTEKQRLEEKQRAARRQRGLHRDEWKPRYRPIPTPQQARLVWGRDRFACGL